MDGSPIRELDSPKARRMSTGVGTVSALMRYPVKSMLGEEVEAVEVAGGGLVGDRAYALMDEETGKVVSVKHPRRWGRIFELTAMSDGDDVIVASRTAAEPPSATTTCPAR